MCKSYMINIPQKTLRRWLSRQNDRVYGRRMKGIPIKRLLLIISQFPKKVMVSVGVLWPGNILLTLTPLKSILRTTLSYLIVDYSETANVYTLQWPYLSTRWGGLAYHPSNTAISGVCSISIHRD